MKRFFVLSLPLILAACSTTGMAPAQSYRAAGQSDQWAISSSFTKTQQAFSWSYDYQITILIDGSPVLSGLLSDSALELSGMHQGKRVDSSCVKTLTSDLWSRGGQRESARCTVFINNERAATLIVGA